MSTFVKLHVVCFTFTRNDSDSDLVLITRPITCRPVQCHRKSRRQMTNRKLQLGPLYNEPVL